MMSLLGSNLVLKLSKFEIKKSNYKFGILLDKKISNLLLDVIIDKQLLLSLFMMLMNKIHLKMLIIG